MTAASSHHERLDESLRDDALESEIELVSELVVAATSSVGPLHQDEVDQLLGVVPEEHPTKAQSDR
ncbi:MAG TPA: hypothetical protein VIJ15_06915 [Dermatophilaceae bacterium]